MKNKLLVCVAALAIVTTSTVAVAEDGGCGDDDCAVGQLGQGGVSSDGKAQGFHFSGAEGVAVTNSGNALSGRLQIGPLGTISGHIQPGTSRGHGTGIFGDWSGECDDPFTDPCDGH
jgi:hypothetical protein